MLTEKKVPAIRFEGFSGGWKEQRLDAITTYTKGFAFQSADYRGSGTRIIRVSDLNNSSLIESTENNVYISNSKAKQYSNYNIKAGDVVITTVGSKAEMRDSAVGRAIIFNENKGYLLNQNLVKLTVFKKNNSSFVHVQLLREQYSKFIEDIQRGNANQANIAINDLWEYLILCPEINEQTKIGNYFQQLDTLIAQHQKKHDKLLNLKKALLEKLFPKQGTTEPEIRFKGFSGEWEETQVGKLGDVVTGSTPNTEDKLNYGGNYFFVSPVDIQNNRYIESTVTTLSKKGFEKGRVLSKSSVLFVSIGSTIGKVSQLKTKATTNQQINAIVPFEENSCDFIFTLMEKESQQIKKLAATQAVPIINKTSFCNVVINYPVIEIEQTKIGNLFKQLDTLITQHQAQLKKLNNIKQACLEKMFV